MQTGADRVRPCVRRPPAGRSRHAALSASCGSRLVPPYGCFGPGPSRSRTALRDVPMLFPLRGVPQFPVVVEERLVLARLAVDVAVPLIEPARIGCRRRRR